MLRPAVDYISTDVGVDSSSRFSFRSRTDRHTSKLKDTNERFTHTTATVGADNIKTVHWNHRHHQNAYSAHHTILI